MQVRKRLVGILAIFCSSFPAASFGQSHGTVTGTVRGVVRLEPAGTLLHDVTVTILQLKRNAYTDQNGAYEFQNVPPGKYDVIAHLDRVPDVVERVEVTAGGTATADFRMKLTRIHEEVTITASGGEETTFNSIQAVTTLDAIDLAEKNPVSLGEALDHELGVAKRTFGPGTSRPVVRGFDGDRVLVLQDGNRIGSLGFQSGDHAEPIDVLTLEKLEVVKGPATLLYGSNAIGGVVNAITGHESAHPGLRGYVTGIGGTNNYQAGGSGGIEYGTDRWLFWGSGSGQRAGDYDTPIGRITNSYTREGNGSGGFGYYPGKGFFSFDYTVNKRVYGIPFNPEEAAEEEELEIVKLNPRRHSLHFNGGVRDLDAAISGAQFSLQYNDYRHEERDSFSDEVHTRFENKTLNYRGVFDERRTGRWSGSFGFWGLHRDYNSVGEEALAPPTKQNAFALFGLQKADFHRLSVQFGGRFEHNGYTTTPLADRETPDRSFNGFSGAVGVRVPTWEGGAFVANYSHSYRAPSLEELYNLGPHPGNATFEIGNPNLKRERGDGIDLSLRHSTDRLRAEVNYFYYHIEDFVFLAPTGEVEDGLIVANYAQGTSRYTGAEARLDVGVHPNLWLVSKLDYVNAKLTTTDTPLPRIPPLRSSIGFEANYKGFRFYPEVVMSKDQDKLFETETRTAGYTTFNVTACYTWAQQHYAHIFSINAFNLGDRLYRNHLSFIKDFAPEMGRGLRFTYTLRFF